jgi:Fe2+ transport system protein FeoA
MINAAQIPLSSVRTGQKVWLTNIQAGDGLKSRLAAMGMVPNTEILVVSNGSPGPFVVAVKGCRIALGRGMAHKVMVQATQKQKST